jgi:hypothetical protein
LSDGNLVRDRFFREQIEAEKEGWVLISHFLNCNKVKSMGISSAKIAEVCADSTEVDVSNDKTKIRRKDNKSLPEKNLERKRDAKASGKSEGRAAAKTPDEDQVDADGKIVLVEKDFDNP